MKVRYLIQNLVEICDLEEEVFVPIPNNEFNYAFKPEYEKATGLEFIKDEEGKIKGVALY